MKETSKKSTWQKARKLLNDIHLWLGLASGILVFVICLSGTIYVYNTEIKEMAQPELYYVNPEPGEQKLSSEEIIKRVSKESGGKVVSIKIPADPARSYVLTVRKEEAEKSEGKGEGSGRPEKRKGPEGAESASRPAEGKAGQGRGRPSPPAGGGGPGRGTQYMVDPYTGVILGSSMDKSPVAEFMGYMFSLHRWLLLDKIEEPLIGELPNRTLGSYISGTATILFTIGVITGIIIWVPKKARNWRQGLKIKWSSGWKRINHDLHNSLGFYTCILLFLMGITGPQWSFPWYREALRKSLGTYVAADAPKPESPKSNILNVDSSRASLSLGDYIKAADQHLNYPGDYTLSIPSDSADAVTLNKTRVGFFAPVAADKVILDQYNAELIQLDIFRNKPINERISNSIKAIHVGDVYGKFSKLLYFISCLVATSLPITGTLIWINKFKKSPKSSKSRIK